MTSEPQTGDALDLGRLGRVLVTGGFGFLGGHVLEQLLSCRDVDVHVVDDLSSNPVPPEKLLADLGTRSNLSYDISSVEEYMTEGPDEFDVIFHLASPVGPAGVLRHGGRIVSSIVRDTYLLADYALEHKVRLVDVSTSEIYGGGRDGLCREDDVKVVPPEPSFRLEYAIAKLAAETALVNLHTRGGLDVVIVRPFNIAGPRQSGDGGFVLPRFLAQARLGLPLTVFGDGSARRAFSHVVELADGIVRAAIFGVAGTAYNVGNHNNRITVSDLADVVLEVTGSASTKEFVDPKTIYGSEFVEANDKFPEAGRAVAELGWRPHYDIRRIVTDTWHYMTHCDPETFRYLAGAKIIEQLVDVQTRPTARTESTITMEPAARR